jgi:WhiB family redox-sensing transcriptional regulator
MTSSARSKIAWMKDAACRGLDTELFFNKQHTHSVNIHPEVKAVCDSCPVSWDCYVYAEENHLDHGVFGGLSSSQRDHRRSRTGRTSRNFGKIA